MRTKSKKLKHILVATDFSAISEFAVNRAIQIAQATDAKLTILHVLQKKPFDNFLDRSLKKLLPKKLWLTTEEYNKSILQETAALLPMHHVPVEYSLIKKGKPATKILHDAKKMNASLLIIGAHGKYSLRDSFLGTTAEYIAKYTKCPLLIVKNPAQIAYQKMLCTIDFSTVSKKAFTFAKDLFPNTSVEVLHVGDYEFEELFLRESQKEWVHKKTLHSIKEAINFYLTSKLKKYMGKKIDNKSYHVVLGNPGPVIVLQSERLKANLLVLGARAQARRHSLFQGRVANWVLPEVNADILLVP